MSEWEVAPHAGAWIETQQPVYTRELYASHPTRVRGLKRPLVNLSFICSSCRTPRGCVD